MDKPIDVYKIIGIAPDTQTAESLLKAWRRALQQYHPDKLPQFKDHFPTTPDKDLAAMAGQKTQELLSIGNLVKTLAEDPGKKSEYDQALAAQRAHAKAPPENRNGNLPTPRKMSGRVTILREDLQGDKSYVSNNDLYIRGSVLGPLSLHVDGELTIEGNLCGPCTIRAGHVTVRGHLQGSSTDRPTEIHSSGRVVIIGSKSGNTRIRAAEGLEVKNYTPRPSP
jgi:hypothetical protein